MLYCLIGKEEFLREEWLRQLTAKMRELPAGEHNIQEFQPPSSMNEVIAACDVTPFLCDKRMVICRGLLSAGAGGRRASRTRPRAGVTPGEAETRLLDYLPHLPTTTHLVLIEEDPKTLQPVLAARDDAVKREFWPVREDALPRWIGDRARTHGATVAPPAARALAALVGPDLQVLDSEIRKLATYVDVGEAIEVDDVENLVAGAGPGVFAFQDAVAERRGSLALQAARTFLNHGKDPAELFAYLSGLVRRLLVVKEIAAQRGSISKEAPAFGLSTSPYALEKLQRQAARLSTADLEHAYALLRDMDVAVKTGLIDAALGLELAVAKLVGLGDRHVGDQAPGARQQATGGRRNVQ